MGEAKREEKKNVSSKHLKMSKFVLKMLFHDSLFFSLRSAFSFFFVYVRKGRSFAKAAKSQRKKQRKKDREKTMFKWVYYFIKYNL